MMVMMVIMVLGVTLVLLDHPVLMVWVGYPVTLVCPD